MSTRIYGGYATAPDDRPAPEAGDQVTPRPGLVWSGKPVPTVPHIVVKVVDYRPDGVDECIVVIQDAAVHAYMTASGHRINADHGAYVGLIDLA